MHVSKHSCLSKLTLCFVYFFCTISVAGAHDRYHPDITPFHNDSNISTKTADSIIKMDSATAKVMKDNNPSCFGSAEKEERGSRKD